MGVKNPITKILSDFGPSPFAYRNNTKLVLKTHNFTFFNLVTCFMHARVTYILGIFSIEKQTAAAVPIMSAVLL